MEEIPDGTYFPFCSVLIDDTRVQIGAEPFLAAPGHNHTISFKKIDANDCDSWLRVVKIGCFFVADRNIVQNISYQNLMELGFCRADDIKGISFPKQLLEK